MRNLKRVLSLALASVMLMGMMVIGAGAADTKKAADLTDMDKVTNKAAVSLLVDLGIIVGKPDGTYAPTETINRATMAKLITFIMMGDVDPSSFAGTTTDLKDVNGHWAEGYIKYCYANGYITGDGYGSFFPDQEVTTVQAAKMLLVALGYDAKDRGYEGDSNWSVNITKDAQKMDLLTNMEAKATDPLTRDNAALLIFNTLFAQTVSCDYSRDINGNKYVSKVTVSTEAKDKLGFITYGLTKVTGTLVANEFAAFDSSKSAAGYSKIKVGDASATTVKIASTTELLGHQVAYYTNKDGSKIISTSFVDSGKTKTYTDSAPQKTDGKFVKDNDLDLTGIKYSVNYGATKTTTSGFAPKAGDTAIYINTDGTGAVEYVVLVSYEFGKVTAVNESKGTLTVTGTFGTKKIADVTGADKVAKDDYVVYATVGGETTVEKATSVTGTVTSKKGADTLVINGTSYKVGPDGCEGSVTVSDTVKAGDDYFAGLTDISKATEQTFFFNKGGLIALVVGSQDTASLYAYINGFKVTTDAWDSTSKTVEVKAVLADGTQNTYTLIDNDSTANSSSLKELAVAEAGKGASADMTTLYMPYKYSLDTDGNMIVKAADQVTTKGTINFKTGKPTMIAGTAFADANTVVLYVYNDSNNKQQVNTYTGIDNIPNIESVANVFYSLKSGSTFVEFAVVVNTAPAKVQSTAKYAYAFTADTALVATGKEVEVIIDGAIETLVIGKSATVTANKIYTYTTDSDGISTLTEVADANVKTVKIDTVGGDYIIASDKTVISLDENATIDDLTTFEDGTVVPSNGALAKDMTIVYAEVGGSGTNKAYIAKAYIVPVIVAGTVAVENIDGTLYATASDFENGVLSYQWYKTAVADGNKIANATSDSYKPTASGDYICRVTVKDQLTGATLTADSDAISVTVG